MSIAWFKSTFSGSEKTCVEVAHRSDATLIRDSKYVGDAAAQPVIMVPAEKWTAFLDLTLSARSGAVNSGVAVAVHGDGSATVSGQNVRLEYTTAEWDAFMKGVADGQFSRR
ncbi:DUF397 domain-containing protein [Nocardia sp. R7R-8]|uniref:DUF397 domain-containing protein n=1 Tax=Nocardia sp. R7R-8 TaxID=3459304 RepID=UPI00403D97FB